MKIRKYSHENASGLPFVVCIIIHSVHKSSHVKNHRFFCSFVVDDTCETASVKDLRYILKQ